MERFTSALVEQLTRWRETGPFETRQLSVTDWFPLYRKNASLADIATAYVGGGGQRGRERERERERERRGKKGQKYIYAYFGISSFSPF